MQALRDVGSEKFELKVQRRPFFLYPGGSHSIVNWGQRVNALYAPDAAEGLLALGKQGGYDFDMDAPLSDTMDSHRLVLWADRQQAGKGEEVAHAVGVQYFTRKKPLADRDMLLEQAGRVGLDVAQAQAYLESEEGYDEVKSSVDSLHHAGVHSIPIFVFRSPAVNFSRTVHGSADVATFVDVLRGVEATWMEAGERATL